MTFLFAAFSLATIGTAHKRGNGSGWAFIGNPCLVWEVIGYFVLGQVIIMILLVVWLFVETQRAVNREMLARQTG